MSTELNKTSELHVIYGTIVNILATLHSMSLISILVD
jgi:hypothetical protein